MFWSQTLDLIPLKRRQNKWNLQFSTPCCRLKWVHHKSSILKKILSWVSAIKGGQKGAIGQRGQRRVNNYIAINTNVRAPVHLVEHTVNAKLAFHGWYIVQTTHACTLLEIQWDTGLSAHRSIPESHPIDWRSHSQMSAPSRLHRSCQSLQVAE